MYMSVMNGCNTAQYSTYQDTYCSYISRLLLAVALCVVECFICLIFHKPLGGVQM